MLCDLVHIPAEVNQELCSQFSGILLRLVKLRSTGLGIADLDCNAFQITVAVVLAVLILVSTISGMPCVPPEFNSLHGLLVVNRVMERSLVVIGLHVLDLVHGRSIIGSIVDHDPGRCHDVRTFDRDLVCRHRHFFNCKSHNNTSFPEI